MNVLIADDHKIFREGLKRILEDSPGFDDIGEASNASELLKNLEKRKWHVVVLDVNMPGRSGLDVLKDLREFHPQIPVLVLSMYPEDQFAVRAMKAGASGYLTKAGASDELILALEKIGRGGKYISPAVAEKLAEALHEGYDRTPHEALSDREFQVLKMIAAGKTVGDIAEELSLSVKTISTYRKKILEKMKLKNNAEIMRYAVQKGLVD